MRLPRFTPSLLHGWPLLGLATLLLLAAVLAMVWTGTSPAGAQADGATPVEAPRLQVSISAKPVSPPVNESTTLTATITNPPSEEKPTYDWQMNFGDDDWYSYGDTPTFRYLNVKAETLGFRLTVSYDTGETATSDPVYVTWVEPAEEPTPEPTEEPTPTPEPTPEPTPDPTEEPLKPPPAPTGLTATGGDSAIELSWSDPSDGAITGYQVRVSADGGTTWDPDWTDISGSGAATTSHKLTGLTNDTAYTIELRAVRGEAAEAAASATATPRAEPPPVPAGLTATGGDTNIELSWSDPSDTAITGYQVRVSADGGSTWDPDWTDVSGSGAATTSHRRAGLTNDTSYTIELRALRGETAGPAASATATPRAEPEPPQAPTDLTATGVDAAIELGWSDPSDSAITGYQVRVSVDDGASWDPDWTDISGSGPATTSHTLTGLTNDTTYTVELRAVRGETAGAASQAAATPRPAPPPAPTDLTATGGDTTIDLSWTDPSDNAISRYQVRVSTDGGTNWNPDWTDVSGSGSATTSHRLTGLTNDTAYTIELRAFRGKTAGVVASATATPRPEPPPAPTGLTATGGDSAIELSWSDPSDGAITGYQVRVSADGGATWDPDWTDVSGSGAATTSHTLTGLTNDTNYTIELRAVRGASSAGPAASATATPSEPAPAEEPAPADAQDGYEPDPEVIDDVWAYARETDNGYDHVLRWIRVLKTLGAVADMTAAEAHDYADQHLAARWDPVVAELRKLENAQGDYEPDQEVVDDVWTYAEETDNGFDHVLRWMRVLKTLGTIADMSAAEAQDYANQHLAARWDPVAEELAELEAARPPNRAPVVNTEAEYYDWFTGMNNAPRGILVSKPFWQVFLDPDGDELTYTVSIPAEQSYLVQEFELVLPDDRGVSRTTREGTFPRVFFIAEEEADWKTLNPPLMHCPVVTATVTATDPDGLSVSLEGPFRIWWECYPEVVSGTASREAIALTFDWEVESDAAPWPGQFTVNVVNGDGSEETVAVSGVSVNGKVVRLELASELEEGQTVTVDFAWDYRRLLRLAGGGDGNPGFTGQPVAWPLLEPPENFALSHTPGSLDISATWDALDGATSYIVAWRQADGEFEAGNAARFSDTSAISYGVPVNHKITVSDYTANGWSG